MNCKAITLALGFLAALTPTPAAEAPPDPADLLRAVRSAQSHQKANLAGSLRTQPADVMKRPVEASFRFIADGPVIQYRFTDPDPVTLRIAFGAGGSDLTQSGSSSDGKFTPAAYGRRVMGTDLTYEDLALRFIYWTAATIEGEDKMKTRPVWRIRLKSPGGTSNYASVVVWVEKESGALFKAEGFDGAGKLIKRFEVVAAQIIKRAWFLKVMRVETFDPGSGKLVSRTSMEIEPPAES